MRQVMEGQVFKNYGELCSHLDEPIKSGKSKQLQLADWQRYFTFERKGHQFTVTGVYDSPLPKVRKKCVDTSNYGSHNTKNINPMIDYLRLKGGIPDGEWHGWTDWYCNMLDLLDEETCKIVYRDKGEIERFCAEHDIWSSKLMVDYVSAAKRVVKNLLTTSLKWLKKNGCVEYRSAYHFTYQLGKRSLGHVYTDKLTGRLMEMETQTCDFINEECHLSDKMRGRQLLMRIYNSRDLTDLFNNIMLNCIMEDTEMLQVLNDEVEDRDSMIPDYARTFIDMQHSVIFYNEVIAVDEIEDLCVEDKGMEEKLAKDITQTIKRKALLLTGRNRTVDLMEIGKINSLLFTHNVKDNDFMLQEYESDKELDELFDGKQLGVPANLSGTET